MPKRKNHNKKSNSCHLRNQGKSCGLSDKHRFSFSVELALIILSSVFFVLGLIFRKALHHTPYASGEYAVLLSAYLLSGWKVLWTAVRNLSRGRIFDEKFLMTVATLGAVAIHELPEAVGVMLFYKVGEFLQDISVHRSRRSIKSLLEVRPDYANLKTDKGLEKISPSKVIVGQTIVIKPGEKIPLDGEITEGESLVDTSALTGESVPRRVKPEDQILAGMVNKTGALTVKVTKKYNDSSVSKILHLVEKASTLKAPTERFITTLARYYTPVVVFGALSVAIFPPLLIKGATFSDWIYRALVLLVISCPCALVISIPVGYFGGIGGASRKGILVKGANYLDLLTQLKTAVFDKTGTLTKGVFKVAGVVPENNYTPEQLLQLAAQAESRSNHPIAHSILEAYGKGIDPTIIKEYQEIPGRGLKAVIEGKTILAGNDGLLHEENIPHQVCYTEGTVVHVAVDGNYAGYIVISDEIREDALRTVQSLRRLGVEKVVMLTGDSHSVAESVARKMGIDTFYAELMPEDKVKAIHKMKKEDGKKKKIAFVGDGINDAPVIALSDVGVAMGGLGSDAAVETADVVIMTDAPSKLAQAVSIARRTRNIVWQNIIMALGVKGFFIVLGILGLATIWEAVFADVGVALLAVLNSIRTIR